MAAHLDAALEDGDPAVIMVALGDSARIKGMSQIRLRLAWDDRAVHEGLPDKLLIAQASA